MTRGLRLRLLVLCSALLGVAALAAGVVGLVVAGQVGTWAVNASWTLGGLVGLSGTHAAALQVERSRVAWAWRVWAAAIALWLVGVLVVDVLTALGVSFWLYVAVLWTLAAVVSIVGLAMRSAPGWLSFRLFVLDALPVAFLVSGVVLALAGGTAHAELWALVLVSSVIYAVLMMISIQIVVWLASRATNMYLIAGGFSLAAVAGIVWPLQARANVPQAHWSSVLLTIAFLVVAVAGFGRAAEPHRYTVLRPLEREHAVRSVPGATAVVVLIVATGTTGGHFFELALAATSVFALRSYLVRRASVESERKLARLAQLDPLTSLLNRRGLQDALVREYERSKREGSGPLVALLVDLDDFKHVNVRLGYGVGDIALRDVGHVLQASVRATDHAARIGGDEALVLLPGSSPAEGVRVAKRIRHGISGLTFSSLSEKVQITAKRRRRPCTAGDVLARRSGRVRRHRPAREQAGGQEPQLGLRLQLLLRGPELRGRALPWGPSAGGGAADRPSRGRAVVGLRAAPARRSRATSFRVTSSRCATEPGGSARSTTTASAPASRLRTGSTSRCVTTSTSFPRRCSMSPSSASRTRCRTTERAGRAASSSASSRSSATPRTSSSPCAP